MFSDRRKILAALASAIGLGASGCARRSHSPAIARGLDVRRLSAGSIDLVEHARPGQFDFGVCLPGGPTWALDGAARFPLINVAAVVLAAAALAETDAGRLSLNEPVRIEARDLGPPPSRINRLFPPPNGVNGYDIPVAVLISLAVQHGDVTAADAVLRRLGGPPELAQWLGAHGLSDVHVSHPLRESHAAMFGLGPFQPAWSRSDAFEAAKTALPAPVREEAMAAFVSDPANTTTTSAALTLLDRLAAGRLLSPSSTSLLLRLMRAPDPSRAGLASALPAGSSMACMSGASGVTLGITPAAGALAIVTLADGRRLAFASFLAGSTLTASQRNGLFARTLRLAVSSIA